MNTKKTDNTDYLNNEELITQEKIEDTPFHIIGTKQGYFGAVGKYRITEPKKTKTEVKKELKEITYNRIVQIVLILMQSQRIIDDEITKSISKAKGEKEKWEQL